MGQTKNENVARLLGAFLIVVAVLLLIIAYQGARFADYRKNGVVAEATVANKYIERTRKVATGSSSHRNDFLLDVTFFTDKQTTGAKFITAEVQADEQSVTALQKGDRVQIIYLPDDPQRSAVLSGALEAGTLEESRLRMYRQKGVTVQGTVRNVDSARRVLEVSFMTSFSGGLGNFVSATLDVPKSVWDSVEQGGHINVVYLPQDPENQVIAEQMLEKGAVNPYLMSGLALLACIAGVWLMVRYGRAGGSAGESNR